MTREDIQSAISSIMESHNRIGKSISDYFCNGMNTENLVVASQHSLFIHGMLQKLLTEIEIEHEREQQD